MMETKNSDGWIEWNGGEMPVPDGTVVDVMFRNGEIHSRQRAGEHSGINSLNYYAGEYFFIHTGSQVDIIKYRIVEPTNNGSIKDPYIEINNLKKLDFDCHKNSKNIKKYKRKIRNKSIEISLLREEIYLQKLKIMELNNYISSYKNVHNVYSRSLEFVQDNAALACALVASEDASPDNAERLHRLIRRDEKAIIQRITDAEMELHNGRELPF